MSCNHQNSSDDNLNVLFTKLADFQSLSKVLLTAKDKEVYELWFEKLYAIDKRTLYFFLCEHYNEIPCEFIKLSQCRFKKQILPKKKV